MNVAIMTKSVMLYIDPSVTSVLISSLTALAVALGATFIILWRKFKKKVNKAFKIDPNKNKEVEEDIQITDDELVQQDEQTVETLDAEQSTAETQQSGAEETEDKQ